MLRKQSLISLGLACLVVLPLAIHFVRNVRGEQGDVDEASWVYKTYYYHLAFRQHDFFHPAWQDEEMYDGPPLGRWVFGAALATRGLVETSPDHQKWWAAHVYDLYQYPEFLSELKNRTSPEAILTLRSVAFLFALAALVMVYLIGSQLNTRVGVIAALAVAWNPLFQKYSALGMTDTQVLFWISAGVALQLWLIRRLGDGVESPFRLASGCVILALVLALGFLTKITAVMGWINWLVFCGLQIVVVKEKRLRIRLFKAGLGILFLAWIFAVILNPTFWPNPVGNFLKMFTHRLELLRYQRGIFVAYAFDDWSRQFVYFIRQIFFENALSVRWLHVPGVPWLCLPVGLILCLMGLMLLARNIGGREKWGSCSLPTAAFVMVASLTLGAQTYLTFTWNWPHYLLPAVPLICVVAAFGVVRGVELSWSRRGETGSPTAFRDVLARYGALSLVIAGLASLVAIGPLALPVNSTSKREYTMREAENALSFHPHDKIIKATLAILCMETGESRRSEELWREVFTPDPEEEILPINPDRFAFFTEAASRHPNVKPIQLWFALVSQRANFLVHGNYFYVNGKPTFLLGASYFGGLGASEEVLRQDLETLKKHGFNWIRVWATWAAFDNNVSAVNPDGSAREPYFSRLQALCTEAERSGLIVDVTLSRGNGIVGKSLLPDQVAHLQAVATLTDALRPYRNVYFDLANERNIHDNRFVSVAELRQLRDLVKVLDPYRLVTASHGGDLTQDELRDYLQVARLDFVSPHRPRHPNTVAETATHTQQLRSWNEQLGRIVPIHYQEPFRRNYDSWQPTTSDFLADLQAARTHGAAGWCFHTAAGFDLRSSKGRFFDQFDSVELEFLENLTGRSLDTARSTQSIQSGSHQGHE